MSKAGRTAPKARKAKGGKVEQDFYDGEHAPARKEAESDKESFARGGSNARLKPGKRKRGGRAAGKRPRVRADRPRRAGGGRAEHSPLTMAAEVEGRPGGHYDGKPSNREDD
ncbi:MAG: hypothetical protein ACLQJR_09915 [Stellaceae bacterium]